MKGEQALGYHSRKHTAVSEWMVWRTRTRMLANAKANTVPKRRAQEWSESTDSQIGNLSSPPLKTRENFGWGYVVTLMIVSFLGKKTGPLRRSGSATTTSSRATTQRSAQGTQGAQPATLQRGAQGAQPSTPQRGGTRSAQAVKPGSVFGG